MGWGQVDWVGRVLPEAKFENRTTLFFEFFYLSDLYIFEHLSLHIHFQAFKPSYTFLWVGRVLPEAKFEKNAPCFFNFFDLSDLYIFEHLSLHIHFQAFKPSYTFLSI